MKQLTGVLEERVQLVGDDLFVTTCAACHEASMKVWAIQSW